VSKALIYNTKTGYMSGASSQSVLVVARRLRSRLDELGLSREKIGVTIGIDESSSRARISRYELGVHEPAVPTARLIARHWACHLRTCIEKTTALLRFCLR
jgi:hypothetical protein